MNNGVESKIGAAPVPFLSRFQTRLILLVLLVCVPALALTIYTNLSQRQTQKVRAQENTIALVRLAASNEENFVKNTRQLLATVTQASFLVYGTDRRFCQVHFINLRTLSPDYLDFGLIEADGKLFASAAITNESPDFSGREFFQRVVQTKRFSIGDFQTNGPSGGFTLDFGYPVLNENGELHRVLYGSLDLALMSKVAAGVSLPSEATLTVFDRKGTVLARHPDPARWEGKSLAAEPITQKILRGNARVFEMSGPEGMEKLFAATSISDGEEPSLFVSVGVPTRALFAEANRSLARNILILGVITIVALVLARWYAKHALLDPLHGLVAAAKQFASGRLDTRVQMVQKRGEFAELASAFDEMAATLEQRQKEIESANAEVRRMNLELEQRVKDRTSELQEANEELEAFSYSVSHDLRAPLRHIGGYAEMLLQSPDVKLGDEGHRHLERVTGSATRMGKLIDDLLHFSRMGRHSIRSHEFDMMELVREVRDELLATVPGRNIVWDITPLPTVHADRRMLKLVWMNLLSNAIKYTSKRERAEITIGARKTSGEFEFFVRDNGSGFDMEYGHKLFGVFQRLHSEREFEGTGIGLANVRRIIQRHGGRTWAEGKVGEGATFYFSLPAAGKKETRAGGVERTI